MTWNEMKFLHFKLHLLILLCNMRGYRMSYNERPLWLRLCSMIDYAQLGQIPCTSMRSHTQPQSNVTHTHVKRSARNCSSSLSYSNPAVTQLIVPQTNITTTKEKEQKAPERTKAEKGLFCFLPDSKFSFVVSPSRVQSQNSRTTLKKQLTI